MAGLNKLHSMFENENLRHDFTMVQMEQMVNLHMISGLKKVIQVLSLIS